jgi:hypothetical protein
MSTALYSRAAVAGSGLGFDDLSIVAAPPPTHNDKPLPSAIAGASKPGHGPRSQAPLAWRAPAAPQPRVRRRALAAAAALCLAGLPGLAAAYGGCSPYLGQVVINEVRIGASNKVDAKNQVELYNSGNVAPAVWQTWTLYSIGGGSKSKTTNKSVTPLNSGFTANGQFIYNNSAKVWLQNANGLSDYVVVVDANGDYVAIFTIEGPAPSVPGCMGTMTVVQSTGKSDANSDIMRPTDGTGAWPSTIPNITYNTIGRTNACTLGSDLVVAMSADNHAAIQNSTTVTYTVTAFNNSCSNNVAGVKILTTNTNATYLGSLSASTGTGTTSLSGTGHLWNIGTLNAGVVATLTLSGKPTTLGTLTTTASVNAPSSGLVNTSDDSDTENVSVQQYNYVGFDVGTDSVTEGTDFNYAATIDLDIASSKAVTVNYSVSGTAGADDTNLPASGSVIIAAGDTSADINFTITNDSVHEPTKSIVLTITSVTSTDATVKLGTTPLGYYPSETITLYDDDPASVDHYELNVPSASLACLASTVTITACADTSSPCTSASTTVSGSTATLAASAGSLAATSVSFNASGVASTTLSYSGAANGATSTVTLSGESTVATNSRKCCPNGSSCSVANSCSSTFSTAGFVIASSAGGASTTLPTQTAGTASSSYVLRAVKTGTSTQACQAAITGSTTVNWAYQCNNPTTCSTGNRMVLTGNSATTIAANPNSGVSSYLSVPMTFDSNGNAPFSFNYSDVGQVTLYATKAASGSLLTSLSGNSNAFVVKPAGFVLSGIKCSSYTAGACATSAIATPGNNPAAASAAGTAFIPAGQAFSATVTAVDSTSAAVPNFGKETSAEGVTLTPALVLPAGGNAGTLANPAAFGSFSSGVATGTSFSYSEVGIITLTPSLASGSYLGTGSAVTGTTTGNVGRFIPNHFTTAVTPGCSGSFTYSGQPLTASVTAKNAAGTTVQNYASSTGFSKAVTLSDGASLGTGSLTGNGIAATAFSAGVASATPTYTYTSKLTSPATLIVRAADADGVGSSGYTEGSGLLRSGRLRLSNGYGRETASLQLALQAEYWTGTSWLLNSSDSCTSIPAAAVAFSNKRNNIGAGTSAWSTTASGTSLAAGSGLLTLSAPSPTATGAIDIALNLGSTTADQSCLSTHPASTGAGLAWLRSQNGNCVATYDRDPSGRASFGIYTPETKKTVHVRELF